MTLGTLPNNRTLADEPEQVAPRRLLRVDASRLRLGLFVTELDRPWMDTPFLIQGFLVDSAIELTTLQRYCRHVFVDADRSTPESVAAIGDGAAPETQEPIDMATRRAPDVVATAPAGAPPAPDAAASHRRAGAQPEPDAPGPADTVRPAPSREAREAASTQGRSYRIRADVRITRETRDRFRKLVRGERKPVAEAEADTIGKRLFGRLRSLVVGADDSPDTLPMIDPALDEELSALGSEAVSAGARPLVPLADVVPGARDAAAALADALERVTLEVRSHQRVSIDLVYAAIDRMVANMLEHADAMLWVARSDEEEHAQPIRAAALVVAFGRQLRLPRRHLHALGTIGLLADIGKCLLPRALLEKPGMLNAAEYSIVKEHVRLGLEALGHDSVLDPLVAAGIAQHHERLDGSGYPKGLARSQIGLHGRMAAIVDSFSALCAPRAYANALAPQDALMSLFQWSSSSFDTALVEQFVRAIGVFPVGTLVELSTGEIAAVVAQDPERRLSPRVVAITHPDRRPRAAPLEVPIGRECGDSSAAPTRVVRGLPASAHGLPCPQSHPDEAPASASGARDE